MEWLPVWLERTLSGMSGAAVLGTIIGLFPPLAALVAVIFYCIQIHESDTYRHWRRQRRARKLARLQVAMAELQAQQKVADEFDIKKEKLK